jgi:hypothetical protein
MLNVLGQISIYIIKVKTSSTFIVIGGSFNGVYFVENILDNYRWQKFLKQIFLIFFQLQLKLIGVDYDSRNILLHRNSIISKYEP